MELRSENEVMDEMNEKEVREVATGDAETGEGEEEMEMPKYEFERWFDAEKWKIDQTRTEVDAAAELEAENARLQENLKELLVEAYRTGKIDVKVKSAPCLGEGDCEITIIAQGPESPETFRSVISPHPTETLLACLEDDVRKLRGTIEVIQVWEALQQLKPRMLRVGMVTKARQEGRIENASVDVEHPETLWGDTHGVYGTKLKLNWETYFQIRMILERLEAGKMLGEVQKDLDLLGWSVRCGEMDGHDVLVVARESTRSDAGAVLEQIRLTPRDLGRLKNAIQVKATAVRRTTEEHEESRKASVNYALPGERRMPWAEKMTP